MVNPTSRAAFPATSPPFGLTRQVSVPLAFSAMPPGLAYDPARQVSTVNGRPLAEQPDLLAAYTVTYGTPNRDNETDAGG